MLWSEAAQFKVGTIRISFTCHAHIFHAVQAIPSRVCEDEKQPSAEKIATAWPGLPFSKTPAKSGGHHL